MSSIDEVLKLLQEKIEDLQRDTKFCVNNYDYHHKNNEHEIVQNIQSILEDSLHDGQEFLSVREKVYSSMEMARRKCLEIDVLITDLGIKDEISEGPECCSTGSQSFHEEHVAAKYCVDTLEENKEN